MSLRCYGQRLAARPGNSPQITLLVHALDGAEIGLIDNVVDEVGHVARGNPILH
jgi:hypothetical protein